jgi:hypothetical protein
MKNLFTKILMLLFIISLSSCGMSKLISVDRGENTINYYNSIDKTIFLDFGELTSISEDKKYGNLEIKVDEITKDIADNGAVIAYIQRPASEGKVQRWSQFPQYSLTYENPSFSYLSFGEGFIRISLQSETTVVSAAEFFKGKMIKLVILK